MALDIKVFNLDHKLLVQKCGAWCLEIVRLGVKGPWIFQEVVILIEKMYQQEAGFIRLAETQMPINKEYKILESEKVHQSVACCFIWFFF